MPENSLPRIAKIMAVKWITKLKPNNLLVSNDVNVSFAAEEYILTAWRRDLLVSMCHQLQASADRLFNPLRFAWAHSATYPPRSVALSISCNYVTLVREQTREKTSVSRNKSTIMYNVVVERPK